MQIARQQERHQFLVWLLDLAPVNCCECAKTDFATLIFDVSDWLGWKCDFLTKIRHVDRGLLLIEGVHEAARVAGHDEDQATGGRAPRPDNYRR